ncbi:unnamed protein product [Penicillium olsonii]|uniref:Alpha/beta hydrolase fold-3 domain-containing protein n=1 Tax=Penicillium olsonii TaxID=99116 RepID=A0A9W4HCI7_PENOL|nr:unnamed protein product [Penicillium olsonii]CAG7967017.1 unnamed protein product [Penicillium olsonii]CAG7970832.1 unnamed protein product [Penicillium olsonii]
MAAVEATLPLPPYDAEITKLEDTQHRPLPTSFEELLALRAEEPHKDETILSDPDLIIEDLEILAPDRVINAISMSSCHDSDSTSLRPGILFCHGGGRVMGNVYVGLKSLVETVKAVNALVISIDYRLSPEYAGICAVDDCYNSLLWVSRNFERFNIDPDRFMIAGVSAGAGLAAGTVLLSRDRCGPKLCAQLLMCPMLDDRCNTASCLQFENGYGFYTAWDRYAWSCILGAQAGAADVSLYVAPARASDLSNLPLAYIDVGSGEPFRDECIAYATRLWACGVQAHLHVWGGGPHGFDLFYEADLAFQARATRNRWLRNFLHK